MTQKIYDWWINVKIFLNLPLPLRNFYHKGVKLEIWKHWFCKSCHHVYNNIEWKNNGHKTLSEVKFKCPKCGSSSVIHSTKLSKAIIENRSTEELIEISNYDKQ